MRVALIHDYLNQFGGAERVLEALHELFPQAPVYTSLCDPEVIPQSWRDWDIRTSFMQRLPGSRQFFRLYLAWYPLAFESFDLRGYDVILSSSSAFAKGIIPPDGCVHACYCHNTARFLWNTKTYLARERFGPLFQRLLRPVLHRLRQWDVTSSARVDAFIANSRNVATRIQRYYRRESTVINPPVPVSSFPVAHDPGRFFLTGGRLIPYKRIDLAVTACSRLKYPLVVFGEGRDRARLEGLASPLVHFAGRVSEEELRQLYRDCRAFIFPGQEDFGITPVEAMASGRPVIAYAAGGALETVIEGKTGRFFREQTTDSLIQLLRSFREDDFDSAVIRAHAEHFDTTRFQEQIQTFVHDLWMMRSRIHAGANGGKNTDSE